MNNLEPREDGWLTCLAAAKVNLLLSVHGRREDGFHELTSVMVALDFGDELEMRIREGGGDTLVCDAAGVPLDESNLILRAARLFREATGRSESFEFRLLKKIPVGAGLGGGSSDAVAALKGMNALLHAGMDGERLRQLSAQIGSDCPFFVEGKPALVSGRGERIEPLDPAIAARLSGKRLALFRPDFGVNTAWAYGRFVAMPEFYEDTVSAERRLSAFRSGAEWNELLHNNFEAVVGAKYMAMSCLLDKLRRAGHRCVMSGSGSACLALVEAEAQLMDLKRICSECWGDAIFWVETNIVG